MFHDVSHKYDNLGLIPNINPPMGGFYSGQIVPGDYGQPVQFRADNLDNSGL
jgi:hypothetical protein